MTDAGPPPVALSSGPGEPSTVAGAAERVLAGAGGLTGLAVAAAPTVAFATANAVAGLTPALITLAVVSVAAFGVRLARREKLAAALVGLLLAVLCALVAAITGEARAFFLIPTLLPAAILVLCLGSLLIRRPLTGVLLNRLAGGPSAWRAHRDLMRLYVVTTLSAVAVNIVNFAVQAVFYLADQPVVLAVTHVATGPVFAALVAATVVAARRRLALDERGA